MLNQQLFIM